jgi:hypothetical protein
MKPLVRIKGQLVVVDVGPMLRKSFIKNIYNKMFKPGESGNPEGRKKGTQNKYTKQIKEAFGMLLEGNLDNLSIWLSQVAADDPAKALDIMMRMSERFVPKLKQTEITGGEDLLKNVKFRFGPDVNDEEGREQE